jgi:glycosyltransferase involved in cell wall biosynthesis
LTEKINHLLKVGIECESIEGSESWGVGRIVKKLLEEISKRPELQKEFKFFLYFKSEISDLPYLNSPIFVKKAVKPPLIPSSFSLYYYLFLPVKLYFEKLDAMFFPNYMLPIIFRGTSLVILTEDIYHEITTGTLPFRYKLAYKIFAGWAAKRAAKIMAISETSAREISKLFGIAPERIAINQLGVDRPERQATSNKQQAIENYILYVGQAFPRRHLKETMLAYEKIAPRFSNLKLLAVGKDKYEPPIAKSFKNEINKRLGYDGIIYREYVSEEELESLYTNAEALVYVSSKEAFGLPPLEALVRGTVPIVADSTITREIFGDNAFFVENPDDPDSIASTLVEALTNQTKREAVVNSANRILEKYNWPAHASRFIKIVKGLANKQ